MRKFPTFAVSCLAILALAACSLGGGSTTATSGIGGSSAPTSSPPTATPTRVPVTCATLLPGAATATAGSQFSDVSFPVGSVGTALTLHSSGTGQWTIELMQVCSPGTTAMAVRSFFATRLPANSWAYSATLPFNGVVQAACGDAYCWAKDSAPRYVGLEHVADASGGNVTYQLRLFVPPAMPVCPDPYGVYAGKSFTSFYNDGSINIPLPPLTKLGVGDGFGNSTFGGYGEVGICSAGDTASVNALYASALPGLGWTYGTPPALFAPCHSMGSAWYKGRVMFSFNASGGSIPNGILWAFNYCVIN